MKRVITICAIITTALATSACKHSSTKEGNGSVIHTVAWSGYDGDVGKATFIWDGQDLGKGMAALHEVALRVKAMPGGSVLRVLGEQDRQLQRLLADPLYLKSDELNGQNIREYAKSKGITMQYAYAWLLE